VRGFAAAMSRLRRDPAVWRGAGVVLSVLPLLAPSASRLSRAAEGIAVPLGRGRQDPASGTEWGGKPAQASPPRSAAPVVGTQCRGPGASLCRVQPGQELGWETRGEESPARRPREQRSPRAGLEVLPSLQRGREWFVFYFSLSISQNIAASSSDGGRGRHCKGLPVIAPPGKCYPAPLCDDWKTFCLDFVFKKHFPSRPGTEVRGPVVVAAPKQNVLLPLKCCDPRGFREGMPGPAASPPCPPLTPSPVAEAWMEKPSFGKPLEEHLAVSGREIAFPVEACVTMLLECGMQEEVGPVSDHPRLGMMEGDMGAPRAGARNGAALGTSPAQSLSDAPPCPL